MAKKKWKKTKKKKSKKTKRKKTYNNEPKQNKTKQNKEETTQRSGKWRLGTRRMNLRRIRSWGLVHEWVLNLYYWRHLCHHPCSCRCHHNHHHHNHHHHHHHHHHHRIHHHHQQRHHCHYLHRCCKFVTCGNDRLSETSISANASAMLVYLQNGGQTEKHIVIHCSADVAITLHDCNYNYENCRCVMVFTSTTH